MGDVKAFASLICAVRAAGAICPTTLTESLIPLAERILKGGEGSMAVSCVRGVVTLNEALAESGLSRNYFQHPTAELGNRTRLEMWEEEGTARRAGRIWLINVENVPGMTSPDADPFDETPPTSAPPRTPASARRPDSGIDRRGILNNMTS